MTDYVSDAQARSCSGVGLLDCTTAALLASMTEILHVRLEIMRSGLLLQAYPKVL